ncbi:MAG: sigma 54-interacting transcriptional regulator [Acidobacteria bacterium]|uniref:Sigma 54-interacting transcriptional regulator n=1 Tax=Candidatus Polarisedimenticola svalbardensis TaxID=2886004 RepID=A0A8J7CLK2_9BACT|nr:sigma 54-interacting transcriptional regulator [Candidatus Polarisedimenticola svalbardensis]
MSKQLIQPELILDHILDGLVMLDTEGRILWANPVFRQMVGRAPDEDLSNLKCCDMGLGSFCELHCPAKNQEAGEGCASAVHFNVQIEPEGGKGVPGTYCFVTSPVRDPEGNLMGYMENFRGMDQVREVIMDLKEVNEAIEAERRKTEDLVDSLADGVFSVDRDLRIRKFSKNMEKMLGVPESEALGRECRNVLRGTLCDTDCPLLWSRENGSPVTGCRERLLSRDGRPVEVSITTGMLKNEPDFEGGMFGVVTDYSEVEILRTRLEGHSAFENMIGESKAMQTLFHQIEGVAPTEATVLILGDSGTGKELVALALHRLSSRSRAPFVSVNCAALVDELLESELFGHVKGAFTGAVKDRRGRFEQAAGGTLFLDEVGDTSASLQAKLLRAIQEKTIEPVGSSVTRQVDVRIIAATNKDLEKEVAEGRFREDLFYRLNVIPVHLPALRERKEDIPLLVNHFIRKFRDIHFKGKEETFTGISERALALMMEYHWPGNVRELEHAVEYAMISSDQGRIERAFLPLPLRKMAPPAPASAGSAEPVENLDAEEQEHRQVEKALERNHWNIGRTAVDLAVSRTTLWRQMKRLGIQKS